MNFKPDMVVVSPSFYKVYKDYMSQWKLILIKSEDLDGYRWIYERHTENGVEYSGVIWQDCIWILWNELINWFKRWV